MTFAGAVSAEPIVVPESVISDWDLAATLGETYPGNLLPSRVAYSASQFGLQPIAPILEAQASLGLRPQTAEVVRVPKLDKTTRPATDLPWEDQILYSSLIKVVRAAVVPGFVDFTGDDDMSYSSFEKFPLEQPDVAYVLETDVAAFYQYVDHERLAYELAGLTGRVDAIEPLLRLLEVWMGHPRGLPQGPPASYVLADICTRARGSCTRSGWVPVPSL